MDIDLLKIALIANPWQLGDSQWDIVEKDVGELGWNGGPYLKRTLKKRVTLLMEKLEKEVAVCR